MKRYSGYGMLLLGLVMFLSGCASHLPPAWYMVTGTGMSEGINPAQARLMAKRAAELDARRQLLEHAKGVVINSNSTVQDFMTRNDYIRSRVEGIIRDAEIVDTRYNDDGTCEVDMRIDMNQIRNTVR